jgi:MtN3 and saliva related transmembrane protein
MENIVTNMIGFMAAACIATSLLPQIFKSWKTKQVEDVSLVMIFILLAGSLLWLTYGILLESAPIIVSDGLATLTTVILLGIKLKYHGGKNGNY